MQNVFITGTDTGVGKTLVAAALLATLRAEDVDVVPMKPVQTGCRDRASDDGSSDVATCLRLAACAPPTASLARMVPYVFEPACSPHLAARLAGVEISFDTIAESYTYLCRHHEGVIIEGAGGLLVPVHGDRTMLDLAAALRVPTVLVCRYGLGTLNHTLLSVRALEAAGVPLLAIVFNAILPADQGTIEHDNVATLERLARPPLALHMPYLDGRDLRDAAAFRGAVGNALAPLALRLRETP